MPTEATDKLVKLNINGIGITSEAKRFYTMGALASHVIGFVDIDNKGLAGIEAVYNDTLIDKGGKFYVERDAKGNRFFTMSERETLGKSLVLTIDSGLQLIVENELDAMMEKWQAESATAVMMSPYTGEILAMANRPTYDPNEPGKYDPATRRNLAITDYYEPGSTFKLVTATGVLEEKLVKPTDIIDCSAGSITVGGKRIKDAHHNGALTFLGVIQKSSNVGTVQLALRLGKEGLYRYMKLYGFGNRTGIDLQGELSGVAKKVERWSGVSIGAMAIGQEVGVTPLQLVTAYSIVANGGYKVYPHVVKALIAENGVRTEANVHEDKERLISSKSVEILTEALMMVTEKGGTATYATVEGNKVAGKTGTAQLFDKQLGRYSSKDYISSFVGFVPAKKPAFSLVVVVRKPRGAIYGGLVAAPFFKSCAVPVLLATLLPSTVQLALRLGKEGLYRYMKLYGFGNRTGIDLQGELSGVAKKVERWSGVSIGAMAIGQEVGVTPLQLVTAYSIVANGGYKVYPHVVKALIAENGVRTEANVHEDKERLISSKSVEILTEALMMVTEKGGTATYATVEGNKVAGKTGTAQLFDKQLGRYSSKDYISSFVGFVPAKKPAFSLVVVVRKPRGAIYGGLVAAPFFKSIAEKSLSYLNIPREDIIDDKKTLFVDNNDKKSVVYSPKQVVYNR
ncbi:stage V sporulation protein D [Candidatus Magnetoovum chiemensis]|nr:stage V sporulation protein D [Candidatus Magnetoovum chiemensis]